MKPRIIITGIAGFIGSNLAIKLLEKGYEVVGIDNLSYGIVEQIPSAAKFYNVDIRSEKISKIIRQDDIIFHLAAKNCISDCEIDPVDTISNNILGSMNLYHHAVKNNAQKFIYSDSSAVYEGNTNFPSKEEYPEPISTYALSKFFTSKFYNIHNKNTDIKIIGLRYFNVYGPRQDYRRSVPPVMSAFIIKLLRGEQPYIYGKKEKKRDFIHVDDVNNFHEICISNKKVDNQIFNLGSGKNYSVKDFSFTNIFSRGYGIYDSNQYSNLGHPEDSLLNTFESLDYIGEYYQSDLKVKPDFWSPNYIKFSNLEIDKELKLNLVPSNAWIINGKRIFENMRIYEPQTIFSVKPDQNGNIEMKYQPKLLFLAIYIEILLLFLLSLIFLFDKYFVIRRLW